MGLPLQQLKLSQDLIDLAKDYAKLINCEFDSAGRPEFTENLVVPWRAFAAPETPEMIERYNRLSLFWETYSNDNIVRSMVAYVIILLRDAKAGSGIKDIEKELRAAFSQRKDELFAWASTETGEWWLNRSLRVVSDPDKNSKMHNGKGEIDFYGVACHAYRQFCYRLIDDVIKFVEYGQTWTPKEK